MNNQDSKLLWNEIELFINGLNESENEHEIVINFLTYVKSKIKCGKCRNHFQKFIDKRGCVPFTTREQVEQWFRELKFDIKKQKTKTLPMFSKTVSTNRFSKIKSNLKRN